MKDSNLGMIPATLIVATVMIVFRGGSIVLILSLLAGAGVWLSGGGVLTAALAAFVLGLGVLAVRSYRRHGPGYKPIETSHNER